jgi:hypothetical protein
MRQNLGVLGEGDERVSVIRNAHPSKVRLPISGGASYDEYI